MGLVCNWIPQLSVGSSALLMQTTPGCSKRFFSPIQLSVQSLSLSQDYKYMLHTDPTANSVQSHASINICVHIKNPKFWQPYIIYGYMDTQKCTVCTRSTFDHGCQNVKGIETGYVHNLSPKGDILPHFHRKKNVHCQCYSLRKTIFSY